MCAEDLEFVAHDARFPAFLVPASECPEEVLQQLEGPGAGAQMLLSAEILVRVLQCVAVCCSVVQCGAVWCRVVQSVAVCCSVLPWGSSRKCCKSERVLQQLEGAATMEGCCNSLRVLQQLEGAATVKRCCNISKYSVLGRCSGAALIC